MSEMKFSALKNISRFTLCRRLIIFWSLVRAQVGAQEDRHTWPYLSPVKRPFLQRKRPFFNLFESDLFHGADTVKTSQRQDLHNYLLSFT